MIQVVLSGLGYTQHHSPEINFLYLVFSRLDDENWMTKPPGIMELMLGV